MEHWLSWVCSRLVSLKQKKSVNLWIKKCGENGGQAPVSLTIKQRLDPPPQVINFAEENIPEVEKHLAQQACDDYIDKIINDFQHIDSIPRIDKKEIIINKYRSDLDFILPRNGSVGT